MATKVIACGGTIESVVLNDGIKEVVGGLEEADHSYDVVRFRTSASFALTSEDLIALARLVVSSAVDSGLVVTCGTDTLEDVAFLLDCVAPDPGVVVTGAAYDLPTDGFSNLAGAEIALQSAGFPKGTACVVFAGAVRAGRSVEKSGPPPDVFEGSSAPPIGFLRSGVIEWVGPVPSIGVSIPSQIPGSIGVLMAHVVGHVTEAAVFEPEVLVVGGFGAGNLTPDLWDVVLRRLRNGGIVVLCSTHPSIGVARVSRDRGGGAALLDEGAWSAKGLSPRKAALACLVAGSGREMRDRFDRVVAMASSGGAAV